jgi:hypothetical protein
MSYGRIGGRLPALRCADAPNENGIELAVSISKMLPTTRILLFSGQAGISKILLDGHKQGFEFELIAKPIHPLKLIEHLKTK